MVYKQRDFILYFFLVLVSMVLMACSSASKTSELELDEVLDAVEDVEQSEGTKPQGPVASQEEDSSLDEELDDSTQTQPPAQDLTQTTPPAEEADPDSAQEDVSALNEELDNLEEPGSAQDTAQTEQPAQEPPDSAQEDVSALNEELDNLEEPGSSSEEVTQDSVAVQDSSSFANELDTESDSSQKVNILDIGYVASRNGGVVEIKLSGPASYKTRFNEETDQFIIEISGTYLSQRLKRPYIMKDFGGPFKLVNAYQDENSSTARIVVQMDQFQEPLVQMEDNSLLIIPRGESSMSVADSESEDSSDFDEFAEESSPVEVSDKEEMSQGKILGARSLGEFFKGTGKYYGKPINIEAQNVPLGNVIDFITQESGINMMVSEEVKRKTVNLRLRQIPWDEALILLLRSNGLGYIRQGSVLRIDTLNNLKSEMDQINRVMTDFKSRAPVSVKVIPINYADMASLTQKVQPFLTQGKGNVQTDLPTNSLILTDTEEQIEKIEKIIKELDIPPAQVIIEGKIIEAVETFSRELGISWGTRQVNTLSQTGGKDNGAISLSSYFDMRPVSGDVGGIGTLGFNLGTIDFLGSLNATLAIAENDSLAKVISSPRIVTLNREEASISQEGQVITIQGIQDNRSSTITRNAQPSPVTLSLTVTPRITNDGNVIMDISVQRQFPGPIEDAETKARAINSRQAKTKVLVRSGETAVIGGVYQNDESFSVQRIPWISQIPVLGWLFKNKSISRNKNELLIFLTPRILAFGEKDNNAS